MTRAPEAPPGGVDKHLQLGVDLDGLQESDPEFVDPDSDPGLAEDVWADATTVEQFKEDIELLDSLGGL